MHSGLGQNMTATQSTNYKQKFQELRRLQNDLEEKNGRGALLQELFAGQGWYLALLKHQLLDNRKIAPVPSAPAQPSVLTQPPSIPLEEIVPSEMDTTLSALEAFAAKEAIPAIVKEIKPHIVTTSNTTIKIAEANALTASSIIQFNLHDVSFQQMSLDDKSNKDQRPVDLLVIGSPEKESHGKAENNYAEEKWLLLGKMLKSMSLDGQRIAFSLGLDFDEQTREIKHDRFYREFRLLRPRLVLALGATATNMLLLRRERLSQIHGQIFSNEIKFSDGHELTCFFMPIYHPDFLLINPNMKRATWEDMKQAMLFLKTSC